MWTSHINKIVQYCSVLCLASFTHSNVFEVPFIIVPICIFLIAEFVIFFEAFHFPVFWISLDLPLLTFKYLRWKESLAIIYSTTFSLEESPDWVSSATLLPARLHTSGDRCTLRPSPVRDWFPLTAALEWQQLTLNSTWQNAFMHVNS